MWSLVLSPEESGTVKVAAFKELHNLSKTSVLLLKDLPFVMNLSKYYDPNILDPNRESLARLGKNPYTVSERTGDRSFSFLSTKSDEHKKHHSSLVFNTLERIESRHTMDDELTEKLRAQTEDIDDNEENAED